MRLPSRSTPISASWCGRAKPADDLISALAADEAGEEALDEDEVVTMAALILGAGFETTTGLLSNGLLALIEAPEQAALCVATGARRRAVEELLRYDTPVQMLYGRTAVEDMLVGELEVSAGQRLITIVGAANRDPTSSPGPDGSARPRRGRPVLRRRDSPLPRSGAGAARGTGDAARARPAYPNARLAGEPVRRDGLLIRGYASLPVALRPDPERRRMGRD